MSLFKIKLLSFLIAILNLFIGVFNMPKIPSLETVDMSKFRDEPTFVDEFNGDSLDTSKWGVHFGDRRMRRGGYWDMKMAEVYGGALHIKTKYFDQGLNGNPAGWYTVGIDTRGKFEQTYGYAECRCIFPKGTGHWSAFWMFADGVGDITGNGRNGAEIDVMESPYWSDSILKNSTIHTIHFDGYGEAHQSEGTGHWRIDGDPYSEFHTYAVEWNEKEYRFYIDGRLTGVTDFGGVSQAPQWPILSVEVDGDNGVIADGWSGASIDKNEGGNSFTSDFIVDYVKFYQYK